MPNTHKRTLVIAGNIGVGKSSLTERLATVFGWTPFYEAVDENPYLADFYTDMPRWAFHSQMFFLSRRLHYQRALHDHAGSIVQDRSMYEDAEIFACNLFRQGLMSARDYATYRSLYEGIRGLLPPPDLLVYLRANVTTLQARIAQRGRPYEQHIAADYLAQLNALYDEWIASWNLCPVLTIDTDSLNFVHNNDDLAVAVRAIEARLAISVNIANVSVPQSA
jgi:deoxyadenosine/deoxycytidine kinase